MAQYNLPRGTQDFLPEKSEKVSYVEYLLKSVAGLYGYREIRTPIFEHTPLFLRSVGESSDIVNKEMYTFLDKSDRSITLRPEGTAGVIRAFVENKLYATPDFPVKLFYDGPVFRYERPKAGRYRQLNQFGFECIGVNGAYSDAELIIMVSSIVSMLGIKDFKIKINSIGDKESREAYKEALRTHFKPYLDTMCEDCKRRYEQNPLRILDCKVDNQHEAVLSAPKITDYLNEKSLKYFNDVIVILNKYGIPYELDPSLVRGLDYYCDTVFEITALAPSGQDYGAIGAGGRYDGLVEEIGGPSLPAVGMAFGIERLVLLLDEYHLLDDIKSTLDVYVMPVGENAMNLAFEIATFLRGNGFKTGIDYQNRSIKAQFKTVERLQAPIAVIIGEDEVKNGTANVKNTLTKEQVTIPLHDLLPCIDTLLKSMEEPVEDHHCCCGHHHEEDEEHECNCGHHHEEGEEHECCCGHHHEEDEEHECNCGHHHEEGEEHECCCGHHHEEGEEHECNCGHHHEEGEEHECCCGHHHDEDDGEHKCKCGHNH